MNEKQTQSSNTGPGAGMVWGVAITIAAIALILSVAALWNSNSGIVGVPGGDDVQVMGVTNLSSLHLSDSGGTATPVLLVDQTGSGVVVEYRDSATPVFQIADGGNLNFYGGDLSLGNGVAADASILYDGAAQDFYISLYDTADDLLIGLGSVIGTTPIISMDENQDVTFAERIIVNGVQDADSAATNETLEIAFTSPVDTTGNNTHNAVTVDLVIGNATGGTNAVTAIQIDGITGDTDVTETGVNVGSGWDVGLAVDSPSNLTFVQAADAAATGDTLEIVFTSPVDTTGNNTHNGVTVDLAIGNATGGTNAVTAIQIDGITGDAEVTETGINIGSGWDTGLNIPQDLENIGLPTTVSTVISFTAAAGGSGTIATVAAGEVWFVHYVYVNVTTNFDATGDDALLDVGDGNDADGLLDLIDAELQTSDTEGTGAPAGWHGFMGTGTRGVYLAEGLGFIYEGAETIDWLVSETSGTTLSAGEATIYVVYTRIQ